MLAFIYFRMLLLKKILKSPKAEMQTFSNTCRYVGRWFCIAIQHVLFNSFSQVDYFCLLCCVYYGVCQVHQHGGETLSLSDMIALNYEEERAILSMIKWIV